MAEEIKDAASRIAVRRDDGTVVIVGLAAREGVGDLAKGLVPGRDVPGHAFGGRLVAEGAGLASHEAGVGLFFCGERGEAIEALVGASLVQSGVDADTLIEDEAFPLVVIAAAVLEVFQDAAIELEDVFEALALHVRTRFFAADATSTEHDNGFVLKVLGKAADSFGEVAEVVNAGGDGSFEGAEFDFVVVPGVEEGDGAAFVKPLFEGGGGEFGGGAPGGVDAFDAKGDDFFFDAHQHARKGLVCALADFGFEGGETGNGAQFGQEELDAVVFASDEEVDAFGAEEDGAAQSPGLALGD